MTTCKQIAELATAGAAGDLTPAERDAFDQHLFGCERCRVYVGQLEATRASLARLPAPEVPPALEQAALAGFDEWAASGAGAKRPEARPARRLSPVPALATAGAIGLLVAFARQRSQAPDDWVTAVVLAVAALAVAAVAGRVAVRLVVVASSAAVAAALVGGHGGRIEAATGAECLTLEIVSAAAVGGAAWLGARRTLRAARRHALAAGGLAGALAADAALQLTCRAHGALPHLLVFHAGGVLVVAAMAIALARSARATAHS